MNPLVSQAVGSIVRWAFLLGAGYLVNAGIWDIGQTETYAAAVAIAVPVLGWSLWEKYQSRRKLVTALSAKTPMTERAVEVLVDTGHAPSVTTAKSDVPTV